MKIEFKNEEKIEPYLSVPKEKVEQFSELLNKHSSDFVEYKSDTFFYDVGRNIIWTSVVCKFNVKPTTWVQFLTPSLQEELFYIEDEEQLELLAIKLNESIERNKEYNHEEFLKLYIQARKGELRD